MKVFISWSGQLSHAMAQALADWLPNVIQAVKPFLSSEDIQKGARWFQEIGSQLEETHFGVLCLTRSNLNAPWILFEAGALSKQLELARVVPLLVDMKPADLTPPLSQFNAVVSPTKEEIEKLLKAMNVTLGENRLTDAQFAKAFGREWPDMEAKIKDVQQIAEKEPREVGHERGFREVLEEILELSRSTARRVSEASVHPLRLPTLEEMAMNPDILARGSVLRRIHAARERNTPISSASFAKKGIGFPGATKKAEPPKEE